MKTIYKYDLEMYSPKTTLELPLGAKLRHANVQRAGQRPKLWVEIPDTNEKKKTQVDVFIIATGAVFPEEAMSDLHYLNTFYVGEAGEYVFHVYYRA